MPDSRTRSGAGYGRRWTLCYPRLDEAQPIAYLHACSTEEGTMIVREVREDGAPQGKGRRASDSMPP